MSTPATDTPAAQLFSQLIAFAVVRLAKARKQTSTTSIAKHFGVRPVSRINKWADGRESMRFDTAMRCVEVWNSHDDLPSIERVEAVFTKNGIIWHIRETS
jgi:hypothetical protein